MLAFRSFRVLQGQEGFSALDVLVAMGLSTIGMLSSLQFMSHQARSNRSLAATTEFNGLTSSVSLVLAQPETCSRSTLVGREFSGTLPFELDSLDLPSGPIARKGAVKHGLRVTGIRVTEVLEDRALPAGYRQRVVNLALEAEKSDQAWLGSRTLRSDFKMFLVTDSTSVITGCGGLSRGSPADSCMSMGGIYDPAGQSCDLAGTVCDKTGGAWNPATRQCDKSRLNYVVRVPGGPALSTRLASCNPGDLATGGGVETANPGDTSRSYPALDPDGRATGWSCSGHNLRWCYALCHRESLAVR